VRSDIIKIKRPEPKTKIPVNAKCVFKGIIFDVYQWEQELYDGSKTTFEVLKRIDTVNVVPVTKEGKIILLEQVQPGVEPFIGFAGGRIDKGEDVLEAARRELLEETGYKSDNYVLWDSTQYFSKMDWAGYTFIARNCEKAADLNLDAGEKIKLKLIDFEELLELVEKDSFRDFEVAMKILKAKQHPKELNKIRKLLIGE